MTCTVPVTVPVTGSTTGTVEPAGWMVSEPGTLKPATDAVVPAGSSASVSRLPVAGTPGVVVSATGGAESLSTAAAGNRRPVGSVGL